MQKDKNDYITGIEEGTKEEKRPPEGRSERYLEAPAAGARSERGGGGAEEEEDPSMAPSQTLVFVQGERENERGERESSPDTSPARAKLGGGFMHDRTGSRYLYGAVLFVICQIKPSGE